MVDVQKLYRRPPACCDADRGTEGPYRILSRLLAKTRAVCGEALLRPLDRLHREVRTLDPFADFRVDGIWLAALVPRANPNGQWAWIEQSTGAPVTAAVVDALYEGSS